MPRIVDNEQRRADLAAAAARLIARSGLEAATMREVAAEAGWTTGALTHYFADKRELLRTAFEASLAGRYAQRAERSGSDDPLRDALHGALPLDEDRRRHWMVTVACLTQAVADPELAAAQQRAYHEFRRHVTSLCGSEVLAEQLIAAADGIAVQALFDPDGWPPQRQIDQLAALRAALC